MSNSTDKLVPYSVKAPQEMWDAVDHYRVNGTQKFVDTQQNRAEFVRQAIEMRLRYEKQKEDRVAALSEVVGKEKRTWSTEPLSFYISGADGIERY